MVKQLAPVRLVLFCLIAAGGAFCQSGHSGGGPQKLHFQDTRSLQIQRQQRVTWKSLPDAPSARISHPERFQRAGEVRLALSIRVMGANESMHGTKHVSALEQQGATLYQDIPAQKDSSVFPFKGLYPSLISRQSAHYQASSNDKFVGRATDAASRFLVVRDEAGKRRLNASYFMGVLTSVAVHTASRPYWARSNSVSTQISDFGSTVGSDAGMNLLHEFGPGIRQVVTNHMPQFVSRFEARIVTGKNRR